MIQNVNQLSMTKLISRRSWRRSRPLLKNMATIQRSANDTKCVFVSCAWGVVIACVFVSVHRGVREVVFPRRVVFSGRLFHNSTIVRRHLSQPQLAG